LIVGDDADGELRAIREQSLLQVDPSAQG